MNLLLTHMDQLLQEVPVYELENTPTESAARLSYETMQPGQTPNRRTPKLNENFVLRQIVGSWVAVAVGQVSVDFNGMLRLNDTGVLLWNKLKDGADEQDLARALTAEYDVSPETAAQDVQDFLRQLQEAGCLEK